MNNHIIATDWFDVNFLGSFLNENHKVKEMINSPKFTIGDEKISSRVLNHWHEKRLLEDQRKGNKGWRKFSFSEVIWINIIIKLREFGFSIEKIKNTKKYLDSYNSKNESVCSLLDFYILYSLNSAMPVKLLVFKNGDSLLARQVEIDLSEQAGSIEDDYISIDIKKIIKTRFKGDTIATDYLNYNTSEVSEEIESSIYIEKVKSINITLNSNKEFLITKEFIKENPDEIEKLVNRVGKFYEKSVVSNGKSKHYKLIEKKKIKRKGTPP